MPFPGYMDAEQMALLHAVLDEFCGPANVKGTEGAREAAAVRLMALFASGVADAAGLSAALRDDSQAWDRKVA